MNTLHQRRSFWRVLSGGVAAVALSLTAFAAQAQTTTTLKVGATAVPHAELLEFVKPTLKAQGIDLQIMEFSDYVLPNRALADKQLDANFFQHKPYLDTFNNEHRTTLVVVPNGNVHIEPFGAYSRKITRIEDLKDGATVALPNDPSNGARALLLLHAAKIIQLKDPTNLLATSKDVIDNPKNLRFVELDAAQLPRVLPEMDLALINTNYALQAGLNPSKDALLIESQDSPYVNVVVSRSDNANAPAIAKLMEALHSEQTKQYILEHYKGAIIPAF